ncbi:hypothetical protein [Agromyces larvae]|uniref:PD-(D/E)XK endonuclease-like domain-containing protein n=1 Tax=Agromyces larvae TaxID=2929802 RepID=A0ABY4C742_9MICO|nr:hypothetical protein [Agromyces larvae]UOE45911.1 hypothetical protein MTO99_09280 [Agromyces larvae]
MTTPTQAAYFERIRLAIIGQPRTQQKMIGPSELGTDCLHCLAAKLAGWEQIEDADAWLPFIGSAFHQYVEPAFDDSVNHWIIGDKLRELQRREPGRYLVEHRVMVGTVAGAEVWGTSDLFDTHTHCVVDHKLVGQSTLTKAKRAPSTVYRKQAHLYGRGYAMQGHKVERVAISFLPRNAISLNQAVWWEMDYDEQEAIDTLAHAGRVAAQLDAIAAISPEARDIWISGLDRAPGCWDCQRFQDFRPKARSLEELIG